MVILGLGSNSGDRRAYLSAALRALSPLLSDMRISRVLESKALLPSGAPDDWDMPFLNLAVAGETTLSARELFTQIKSIEKKLGRQARAHWAPREIDIDILAMGCGIIEETDLHIPHRELINRDFALLPLAELAPDWRWPLPGEFNQKTAVEIAAARGFVLGDALRDTGMALRAA